MVNDPLRFARPTSPRSAGRATQPDFAARASSMFRIKVCRCQNRGPHRRPRKLQSNPSIASALRTLDAEANGITALTGALQADLGPAFIAAVDLIRDAQGPR